jgi:hypothetical protein
MRLGGIRVQRVPQTESGEDFRAGVRPVPILRSRSFSAGPFDAPHGSKRHVNGAFGAAAVRPADRLRTA